MKDMQIAFRVDASLQSGAGHVMRCLTLANALREQGATCRFVCRSQPGDLIDLLRQHGHEVLTLAPPPANSERQISGAPYAEWLMTSWEVDAEQTFTVLSHAGHQDWLVVDHYALDARWERVLKACCQRLLVVDDLADRPHDCDLLVDQNLGRQAADYAQYIQPGCTRLIGPDFALLRPAFAEYHDQRPTHKPPRSAKHVLISLGGMDKDNFTQQVLDALHKCELPKETHFAVVLGSRAPWLEQIRQKLHDLSYPAQLLIDVPDMPGLLADIDLAIGAAGVSALERCCMGIPTLLVPIAENQWPGATALAKTEAVILVDSTVPLLDEVARHLPELVSNRDLTAMATAALTLCDGHGCSRVLAMMEYVTSKRLALRPVEAKDARTLFQWANETVTRANAINTKAIEWDGHVAWLDRKLQVPNDSVMLIGELTEGVPYGQIRFDRSSDGVWIIDYSIAPAFRYLGFGRKLLQSAIQYLGQRHPGEKVIGRVKLDNLPSRKVFECLDFQDTGVVDDLVVYQTALGA